MVKWSGPAIQSLHEIHSFIARDSKVYADVFIDPLIDRTHMLERFPQVGRIVPEEDNESIREVIVTPYRVIYQIDSDEIYHSMKQNKGRPCHL